MLSGPISGDEKNYWAGFTLPTALNDEVSSMAEVSRGFGCTDDRLALIFLVVMSVSDFKIPADVALCFSFFSLMSEF